VAVRCYESRLGRANVIATNVVVDQTLILWEKSPASVSAEIPDGKYPFKLLIPPDTPGLTTTVFREYKAYWRVEAILEHLPIFGVGNRLVRHFELPLLRFDIPSHSPSTTPSSPLPIPIQSPKSRLPIYHCTFSTPPPSSPIGPGELVSTFLRLQPINPSFSVRSVTVSIERRLDLRLPVDNIPTHSSSPTPPGVSTESFSSLADQSPSKFASTTVVRSETLELSLDSTGALSKTITVQWPPRKQHSWTVGETMTSGLITVKFYIHLRVSDYRHRWFFSSHLLVYPSCAFFHLRPALRPLKSQTVRSLLFPPTSLNDSLLPQSPKTRPALYDPNQSLLTVNPLPRQLLPVLNPEYLHQPSRNHPNPLPLQLADPEPGLRVGHTRLQVLEMHPTSRSTRDLSSRRGTSIAGAIPSTPLVHSPKRQPPRGQYCEIPVHRRRLALLSIMMVTTT
jgi:hypothetical protein